MVAVYMYRWHSHCDLLDIHVDNDLNIVWADKVVVLKFKKCPLRYLFWYFHFYSTKYPTLLTYYTEERMLLSYAYDHTLYYYNQTTERSYSILFIDERTVISNDHGLTLPSHAHGWTNLKQNMNGIKYKSPEKWYTNEKKMWIYYVSEIVSIT
jgi:hypothetical protein